MVRWIYITDQLGSGGLTLISNGFVNIYNKTSTPPLTIEFFWVLSGKSIEIQDFGRLCFNIGNGINNLKNVIKEKYISLIVVKFEITNSSLKLFGPFIEVNRTLVFGIEKIYLSVL